MRILLLICFVAYILEGQYKKVADPAHRKNFINVTESNKYIDKIHKKGIIGLDHE